MQLLPCEQLVTPTPKREDVLLHALDVGRKLIAKQVTVLDSLKT